VTPRHRRRLGVFVGIALLLPLAAQLAASGDPIDDKKAEAAHIQDQLDAQGKAVSVAAQKYNAAQSHLADVQASLEKAQTDLQRSSDRMVQVKGLLADAAVTAYVHGGNSMVLSRLVRSSDHSELVARSQYLQVAANDQRQLIGQLKAAKEDFTALKGKLVGEEKDAKAATDSAAAARRQAVAAEDAQRAVLSRVQGELADLVAAEAARRLAAEAARAPQLPSAPVARFDDVPTTVAVAKAASAPSVQVAAKAPPVAAGAARAVQVAEAQVGKPYVYGGSGPDSFDCSGLTSYAWRAAGVSLSHDAYRQWFETTRVPLDSIQPGDLLFFGEPRDDEGLADDPTQARRITHVAISLGGDECIHANSARGGTIRNSLDPRAPHYHPWLKENFVAARGYL